MYRAILLVFFVLAANAQERELVIRQGHREMINEVLYSADGQHIYTAGEDHVIKVWEVNSGIDIRTFSGHQAGVRSMALSADGRQLISGDASGKVLVWDTQSGDMVTSFDAHEDAINEIKYMPDGSSFLTGSADKRIKRWSSVDYSLIKTIEGMTGMVRSFGISPEGDRLVMGAQRANDVELLLIDVESGAILDDALKHIKGAGAAKVYTAVVLTPLALATSIGKGDVDKDMMNFYVFDYSNIEFTKDGTQVLISQNLYLPMTAAKDEEDKTGGTSVSIVELTDDRKMFRNVNKMKKWNIDYPRSKAVFNEDQTKIIVNIKHSIRIYDIVNAEFPTDSKEAHGYEPPVLQEFRGDIEWLNSIAISPDYRTAVSAGENRELDLWDIQSGRRIRRMKGYTQPALAVEMMPDGQHILVGSRHKNLAVWDLATGRLVRSFDRSADVNHIDISPDGKYMVTTALNTRFFKVWNMRTGNILGSYFDKNEAYVWVKFDEDPEYILAATASGNLHRWSKDDKKMKKLKSSWEEFDDRNSSIGTKLSFDEGTISISGQSTWTDQQAGNITDAMIAANGKFVLTTNEMGEASVYNAATGEKAFSMVLVNDYDFITYTPGYYYTSSKGAAQAIAFRDHDTVLPFEQMEVVYNRPDKVAGRTSLASEKLVKSYKVAYDKRLSRLGYKPSTELNVPNCFVDVDKYPLATTNRTFSYEVTASDPGDALDKLQVFINDVPVNGYDGFEIEPGGTQQIEIELSNGLNEIKTVAVNSSGLSSAPQVMEIQYEGPYMNPDLYMVSIGVSAYQTTKQNLAFAAKDAVEISRLLSESSVFANVHPLVLTDEEATYENMAQVRQFVANARVDDVVIVFIAGHGVLDKDYNYYFALHTMDFDNPSDGGLPYQELETILMHSKSRNKLLFMDTCVSGELDTEEVATTQKAAKRSGKVAFRSAGGIVQYKENPFGLKNTLELSKSLFGDLKKGSGATVISAAGGTEYALEGLDSQNGLFTSSLMEGIKTRRADLNRDRKYTVSELRTYIADRVVNLSRGQQVPTSREENLKNDFRIF